MNPLLQLIWTWSNNITLHWKNWIHLVHGFLEIFWICKHLFSSSPFKLKLLRPWKNLEMKILSLNCDFNLPQTIWCWFIDFLNSWNLLNSPLFKSLAMLKMKEPFSHWLSWIFASKSIGRTSKHCYPHVWSRFFC